MTTLEKGIAFMTRGYDIISRIPSAHSGRARVNQDRPTAGSAAVCRTCACAGLLLFMIGPANWAHAAEEDGLEEITVTAQKRAENSQDVPVTMQVYSSHALAALGVVNATDLAKFTPGLNLAGGSAGQTMLFGIRGVVQVDFSGIAESPVATYVDEGYVAGNSVTALGLFDLDHIEVLKGPQGTLFGRNATGGVVSIATKMPTDTYEGYAKIGAGSYGDHRIEAAFGGPVTDSLRFRVAGTFQENGNWVNNINPGGNALGANHGGSLRFHLDYKPAENAELLVTGYFSENHMGAGPYFSESTRNIFDAAGNVVNSHVVNEPTGLFNTPPSDAKHLTIDAVNVHDNGDLDRTEGLVAKATYDFGPVFTLISAINETQARVSVSDNAAAVPWLFSNNHTSARTFTQEARLNGEVGKLHWLTGAYYLHITSDSTLGNQYVPASAYFNDHANLYTNSYSAFSQLDYELVHNLTLTGAIRGTYEEKEYNYSSQIYDVNNVNYIAPARSPYHGSEHEPFITSKLALQYRPMDDVLLYIQQSRGVKAGSFNQPVLGGTAYPDSEIPYGKETLYAYEMGEKATLLDDHFRVNSSVFYYDYKDFQAFKIIGVTTQVINLPSKVYGAEMEITSRPVSGLTLQASASYTHDRVHNVSLGLPDTVTRTAPYTSPWKAGVLARYEIPDGFGGTFGLQTDVQYTGSFYYSLTNYDTTKISNYTLLDARLTWASRSGKWEASLSGENLTDRRYGLVGFDFTGLCGCSLASYGRPLWFKGEITRRF